MLDESEIIELVNTYGTKVNEGRTIKQIIENGDLPQLKNSTVCEGKVSDSVFSNELLTKEGKALRLMYRGNRISTHDINRGEIPFKDQVLASNHDHMLNLVENILGTSQFKIPNLKANSTVIPAENLELIKLENVLRMYMAESTTNTSLYQHWLKVKDKSVTNFIYAGHKLKIDSLSTNCILPYLLDTPSTKAEVDETISAQDLSHLNICSPGAYSQIRNSSIMAFGVISQYLKTRNMALVDTKTEHGFNSNGQIVSADEVYTMDSSRFWKMNDDGSIITHNGKPVSFSKEFARGMIKSENQTFTKVQSNEIAVRYIQGLQYLTGKTFEPDLRSRDDRIIESTNLILNELL